MKIEFKTAKFIKSATSLKECPSQYDRGVVLPEIAVLGRSNVGKSTLLNQLFQTKDLVKTSSVPGKTKTINFFLIDSKIFFVDLPGYGYAKADKLMMKQWAESLDEYLKNRLSLKLFLFLLDFRHLPSEEDLHMLSWLKSKSIPFIFVFTKVDKLSPSQREGQIEKILNVLNCDNPYIALSAIKNWGRKELVHMIEEALWET